jgi:hypothetical protein
MSDNAQAYDWMFDVSEELMLILFIITCWFGYEGEYM